MIYVDQSYTLVEHCYLVSTGSLFSIASAKGSLIQTTLCTCYPKVALDLTKN